MEKDFDQWNEKKKAIHGYSPERFCHSREIWWCSLGVNIGSEQDGTGENFDRPVVVVRGFNEHSFLGAALTAKKKAGKYYFPIGQVDGRDASVILSQIRLIDSKRLIRKLGMLDNARFLALKEVLRKTLLD